MNAFAAVIVFEAVEVDRSLWKTTQWRNNTTRWRKFRWRNKTTRK
jgi:hypothetical protein